MSDRSRISRRDFVKTLLGGAAAGLAAAGAPFASSEAASGKAAAPAKPAPAKMPLRPLGKTGHQVALFSLGGEATLKRPGGEEESFAIINRALDLGVNYLDTARIYGDGISEGNLGRVMKTRRGEAFLACKTRDRTRDGALRQLEESLTLLQTDHLDLWQMHNLMRDEELDRIFGKDGAIHAFEQAREQKMVRFFGISGHWDPAVLRRGIERYPFDTVLVALNAADRNRDSFIEGLLPAAVERGMGIIGMKIPARGRLLREGGVSSMRDAMRYVLSLPVSTVIVGISTLAELEENVAIAREFTPMAADEMARLEALAKPYAEEASFFKRRV